MRIYLIAPYINSTRRITTITKVNKRKDTQYEADTESIVVLYHLQSLVQCKKIYTAVWL